MKKVALIGMSMIAAVIVNGCGGEDAPPPTSGSTPVKEQTTCRAAHSSKLNTR